MIAVAMLALVLAGGLSVGLAFVFGLVMIASWMLEKTKWQLPERYGLGIVLLSIPLFYLDWHYQKATRRTDGAVGSHRARAPDRFPVRRKTFTGQERSRLGFSLPDLILRSSARGGLEF